MYLIFLLGTTGTTRMQTTPGVASSRQQSPAVARTRKQRQEPLAVASSRQDEEVFVLNFFSYILKVFFCIFHLIPLTTLF